MPVRPIKNPERWCETKVGSNVLSGVSFKPEEVPQWFSDGLCNIIGIMENYPIVRVVIVNVFGTGNFTEGFVWNSRVFDYTFNPETILPSIDGLHIAWVWKQETIRSRADSLLHWVKSYADWKRREPMYDKTKSIEAKMSAARLRMHEIKMAYRENPEWLKLEQEINQMEKDRHEILYQDDVQLVFVQEGI